MCHTLFTSVNLSSSSASFYTHINTFIDYNNTDYILLTAMPIAFELQWRASQTLSSALSCTQFMGVLTAAAVCNG